MNASAKILVIAVVALAGAGLLYRGVDRWYLAPRRLLLEQIDKTSATVANYRQTQQNSRNVTGQLQSFVDRTLGANLETVDHRLRSRLNRLCEESRLQGASVNTEGSGKPSLSPARSKFRASTQKSLRDEIDFIEVEAWISGVGSLEDVVRLITGIESEPWIKRIDQLRLDPRDNGARVSMTLRLTTLFLPGREPRTPAQSPQPPAAEWQSKFAALVSGNPFRVPPAPPPPPPPKVETPAAPPQPAPPPFPFGEWALTGVAQGPSGVEAWLLHRPSGETRVLAPGQSLDAAVFSGAADEGALFAVGDQRFIVAVGATMDQRSPTGH